MCIRDSRIAYSIKEDRNDMATWNSRGLRGSTLEAVSYTHLDVYKRQADYIAGYRLARAYDTAGMVPYAIP